MQKNTKADIENTDPEHFPESPKTTVNATTDIKTGNNNTIDLNKTITTTTTKSPNAINSTERPVNFSFASSYTTSRFNINSQSHSHKLSSSLPAGNFQYKPLSAFTILNSDNYNTSLSSNGKPNAIVRPIRRPEQPALPLQYGNATDTPDNEHTLQQQQSQPTSGLPVTHNGRNLSSSVHSFAEELNRKLRYLHSRDQQQTAWIKSANSSKNGSNQEQSQQKRPLFITTVPTGVFLPPAKEIPLPSFLKPRIYAYASHPVILNSSFYNNTTTTTTSNNFNYNYNSNNNNNNKNVSEKENDIKIRNTYSSSSSPNKSFSFSKDKQQQQQQQPQQNGKIASTIASNDKEFMLNSSTTPILNGIRGYSPSLAGSVNLTKQQFQQQLQNNRAKREVPVEPYKNVMFDKRVIRGSNYANGNLLGDHDPFDKAAELRRRNALRKKCRKQRNVLGTPPPVCGRSHEVVQTDRYLEQLVHENAEATVETQTDLFLARPPTPPYKPAKVGVDASTEIADGELFHFDAEAQPIIDVLVDCCIEQSMLEVAHQREIEKLREKQAKFLAEREAELAKLRRLEAEEKRLEAERERRLRQEAIAKELDEEMQKSVTAAKLLQGHIAGLLPEVLENLEPATDATKKEQLINTICPWLSAEVAEEVGSIVDSREILTVIIEEIIKQRAEIYAGYSEELPLAPEPSDIGKAEECEECGTLEECEMCPSESINSTECP